MVFVSSDPVEGVGVPKLEVTAVKLLVAGGFGVGKTTLVGSVSEIPPLRTEELLTELSGDVDDLSGVESKTTTTVALDFGRITINPHLVLYLFGTPGQDRFWFMWNELAAGAFGAVVLADTRRLDNCFPAVDFFERRGIPFVIAVNCFDGTQEYTVEEVRQALDVDDMPVLLCDARRRESSKRALLALTEYVLELAESGRF
jgi:signal recognition particle receptor subunit beta